MTKSRASTSVSQPQRLRYSTVWLTSACVLSSLIPGYAQLKNSLPGDYRPKGAAYDLYEPPLKYTINGETIQRQLKGSLKLLSHLSVLDPSAYALLRNDLNTYMRQLKQEKPNYDKVDVFRQFQLQLIQFDNQIKAALVESRRVAHEEGVTPEKMMALPRGSKIAVQPYAILFTKPDYHSSLRHVIAPKEAVTVLKDGSSYCRVKCALYRGYVSKTMIIDSCP